MDMGPCPKVHSLQLRKEYPYFCGKEIHFSAFFLNENIQHKVGGKVLDMETYHPVYIFNTSH